MHLRFTVVFLDLIYFTILYECLFGGLFPFFIKKTSQYIRCVCLFLNFFQSTISSKFCTAFYAP